MKRNSFCENSIISFDEESIHTIKSPNKITKYTFNNIDIDTNNYILYLNILGIFILNFSFYYCNYSFNQNLFWTFNYKFKYLLYIKY